jgi:BRCT domain type II-containing protein
MGVYVDVGPFTATGKNPYAQTIHASMTFKKWSQHALVLTTNNATSYWKIKLRRLSDGATIKEINTSTMTAGVSSVLTATSFDIANLVVENFGFYMEVNKNNTPGSLYVFGPAIEVELT